ncbi:hypothetical protein ACN6LM_002304 [Streptomyces sp. SAS_281]
MSSVVRSGAAEHLLEHRHDDDPGQEVREVDDGLDEPLDLLADERVEQQGQGDRCGEVQEELDRRDLEGVGDRAPELGLGQQRGEVRHPDERALLEAQERLVVLEGDDVARERQVEEEDEVQHAGQAEEQKRLVPLDALPERLPYSVIPALPPRGAFRVFRVAGLRHGRPRSCDRRVCHRHRHLQG